MEIDRRLVTDELMQLLYEELRSIARREYSRAGAPQTLQATALIGEVYLKMQNRAWDSQAHFLATAATAMRNLLIDAARARQSAKRGGEYDFTRGLDTLAAEVEDSQIVKLGEALQSLSRLDQDLSTLIDCRFFAGMSDDETAKVLGVSPRTLRRRWMLARAWIHREMADA